MVGLIEENVVVEPTVGYQKPSLTVIIPTRNEAGNVQPLLKSLGRAFDGEEIDVIFVDDSTDDTPQIVEKVKYDYPAINVRLIHRPENERTGGLGGAVILGLAEARTEFACVMDGDLQHPPELVPKLLETAYDKQVDLVIATRRNKDSECQGLNPFRDLASKGLDLIGRIFFPRQLKGVSDPLTGFFLVRVSALNFNICCPNGFKILMEIIVRHPKLRKAEVPFHFGDRLSGDSKASVTEVWRYLNLLWDLRFGDKSKRFIQFAAVGASGILVNSAAIYLFTDIFNIYYLISAGIATLTSTLTNFYLTEEWVYRKNSMKSGRALRLLMFLGMNLLALAVRAPMIYVMTSVLGIFYVLSNLISIGILTIVRFSLSENIIWKPAPLNKLYIREGK